ncbi:hypothetical protein D3C81_1633960 [compost metagenome]
MRFAAQVESFGKGFRECDIREGSAVSQSAQCGLQRIGEAAGFDNDVGTLLSGELFNLQPNVIADRVDAEIRAVATGDVAAAVDRVNANHNGCTRFFCQLDSDLPDGT